jgi:hypothetical protein
MRQALKSVLRWLREPYGFELEWMTGGISFTLPLWSWIGLAILLVLMVAAHVH